MIRNKVRVRWYGKIFNTEIQPQIENKSRINQHNYKIINKGVEDVDINTEHYDLCLTSPPFFDLETYENNSNTQSINKYSFILFFASIPVNVNPVSYTNLRAHEPPEHQVSRLLHEKK